jgi:hypothetical protein
MKRRAFFGTVLGLALAPLVCLRRTAEPIGKPQAAPPVYMAGGRYRRYRRTRISVQDVRLHSVSLVRGLPGKAFLSTGWQVSEGSRAAGCRISKGEANG